MPPEIINILVQIPIVAVFIWYSNSINKQFQEFLREERTARERSFDRIASKLDAHDDLTRQAIARMEERTRPRKGSGL